MHPIKPLPWNKTVDLRSFDPSDTMGFKDKQTSHAATEKITVRIGELQENLYADGARALLIILQGMDASGKDGAVRRVFDHVNPAGVRVTSFKAPTATERAHDFLWRSHVAAPALGTIGIFNRSHYEEVLIVRVHAKEMLPEYLRHKKDLWAARFEMINNFEKLLARNGVTVLKFFLHISSDEQRKRFLKRQQDPEKRYKLSADDLRERQHWDQYVDAYQDMLQHTSAPDAPWYIVPANHKWTRDHAIAATVCAALEGMKLAPRQAEDPDVLKAKIQ